MKDLKRKVRDWDNDNHIMRKYGKTIRAKIAETLIKTQRSIITNESVAVTSKKPLDELHENEFAHA
jgi:hypothetical protein